MQSKQSGWKYGDDWSFADYMEELICIAEVLEVPGMKAKLDETLREVWQKFPKECEDLGVRRPS